MADVPFIDSTGLGVLASKYVTLRRRDGRLKLCNLSPRSPRVLETTKLVTVFEVFASEADAVASFAASRLSSSSASRVRYSAPAYHEDTKHTNYFCQECFVRLRFSRSREPF